MAFWWYTYNTDEQGVIQCRILKRLNELLVHHCHVLIDNCKQIRHFPYYFEIWTAVCVHWNVYMICTVLRHSLNNKSILITNVALSKTVRVGFESVSGKVRLTVWKWTDLDWAISVAKYICPRLTFAIRENTSLDWHFCKPEACCPFMRNFKKLWGQNIFFY